MNLKKMPKDKLQKLALAVIAGLALLAAALFLGIRPLLAQIETARADVEALRAKKADGDAIRKRSQLIDRSLAEIERELATVLNERQPPAGAALAWATQRISADCRTAGLEVESITEPRDPGAVLSAKGQEKKPLKPYAVTVASRGTYEQINNLVQTLESDNPYLFITSLTITAQRESPETHRVEMTIEWPIWKDPAIIAEFAKGQTR